MPDEAKKASGEGENKNSNAENTAGQGGENKAGENTADTTKKADETKVGEIFNGEKPKETKVVPEAVLIEYKKENKQLAKEIADLKKAIEDGANRGEISASIKELSEKHNVDAGFLQDFAKAVKAEAKAEAEESFQNQLKPLTQKAKEEKIDTVFNEHFDKAMENMPEFKNIVNKDVIKSLALDPKNANKSFVKIIEDAYGHLVTGKRTLETTKPQGGRGDTTIDFEKARKDTEYFKEVMADPELKKKYNEEMMKHNKF